MAFDGSFAAVDFELGAPATAFGIGEAVGASLTMVARVPSEAEWVQVLGEGDCSSGTVECQIVLVTRDAQGFAATVCTRYDQACLNGPKFRPSIPVSPDWHVFQWTFGGTTELWVDGTKVISGMLAHTNAVSSNAITGVSPYIQISPTIGASPATKWRYGALAVGLTPLTTLEAAELKSAALALPNPPALLPLLAALGTTSFNATKIRFDEVADPVNAQTGGFDHVSNDIGLAGRGESLLFRHNYDSRQTASSTLGKGWWHPYFSSVAVDGASGVLSWRTPSGSLLEFAGNGSGGFVTPAGVIAVASVVAGGGWQVKVNDQNVYRYDAAGRLVSVLDRSGQGVSVGYDVSGRVSVVSDSVSQSLTLTYGTGSAATGGAAGSGSLVQVKASDNRLVKFGYTGASGLSSLTSVTDVRGKVSTYGYDGNGFLRSETDPNGNVGFTNTFDATGRVVSQLDQLGNSSSFVYDDTAGTTTFTDAAGAVTVFNRAGNVPNGQSSPAGVSSTVFNAALDATGFTDGDGKTWAATYDGAGNMLSRTAPGPLSYVESWTYDGFNNPLTFVDGRGFTTTYGYDGSGRLLSETHPGGVVSSYTWNADGTMATSTDPRGGVTTYTYDVRGNMLSVTSPLGLKTSYTYNTTNRVLTITEPRGNVAGATATGFQQKFTYDAAGNVLTEKDALNRTTTHVYDNAGRRSQSTAPDGGVTLYGYNAADELTSVTAPDGGVTTTGYDARGLRTSETSPIGGVTTFTYDGAGRVKTRVEPRGNVGGANPAEYTTTYTYDNAGRVGSVTDGSGRVTSMSYDVLGRVVTTTRPDGSVTQSYDPNGNVTSMVTDAGTSGATFDSLNRMITATDVRGKLSSFEYDVAGNQVAMVDPLGRRSTSVFDADGRLTSSVDPRGNAAGGNPADYRTVYTYDEAGNQLSVADPLGNTSVSTFDRVGNMATARNPRLQTESSRV